MLLRDSGWGVWGKCLPRVSASSPVWTLHVTLADYEKGLHEPPTTAGVERHTERTDGVDVVRNPSGIHESPLYFTVVCTSVVPLQT